MLKIFGYTEPIAGSRSETVVFVKLFLGDFFYEAWSLGTIILISVTYCLYLGQPFNFNDDVLNLDANEIYHTKRNLSRVLFVYLLTYSLFTI